MAYGMVFFWYHVSLDRVAFSGVTINNLVIAVLKHSGK